MLLPSALAICGNSPAFSATPSVSSSPCRKILEFASRISASLLSLRPPDTIPRRSCEFFSIEIFAASHRSVSAEAFLAFSSVFHASASNRAAARNWS